MSQLESNWEEVEIPVGEHSVEQRWSHKEDNSVSVDVVGFPEFMENTRSYRVRVTQRGLNRGPYFIATGLQFPEEAEEKAKEWMKDNTGP